MENNPELETYHSNIEGTQTMFNVSGRNQLNLIAIADNKANMITAICTALIFMIIALFSSGYSHQGAEIYNNVEFVLPLGILLAFCCISVICAVLSLKPKIVRSSNEGKNVLFFHNFYRMTLEEYKREMHEMMKSREDIYDHMLTNMYFSGLVLERKYALLSYSYAIFLMAIVCSAMAYVVVAVF